ncbi:Membrane-bound lytic murein transglycosylase B [hydrothermal vent metagenome]|uniref:Membrane-bound lytic murein transglycosylase B n=1 Tax=hydrothermal vent metagenome TaxID=652676 RepID=A0A3B0XH97_9ZZZZ
MKKQSILNNLRRLSLSICLIPAIVNAGDNYSERQDVKQFIEEMHTEYGYDKETIIAWMKSVKQQKTALEAIARPAEGVLTWKKYRKIFLTDKRIDKGVQFWEKNAQLLARAEKEYGVSAEFIVAIIGVETYYGKRAGNYPVLDALTTLGFDYPPRATFFRKQLKHYMLMVREEKLDAQKLTGSYAGAMGMPQFIPSSFRSYAVDFDNNGVRDFWNSSADPIGSVANYFSKHGWRSGEPVISRASVKKSAIPMASKKMKPHTSVAEYRSSGVKSDKPFKDTAQATLLKLEGEKGEEYWLGLNNFYVITRYNHSPLYAMAVYQLSQEISQQYHSEQNVN